MNDKTHNGWTNYATWRVNLEMFDGWDRPHSEIATAESLKEIAEDYISFGFEGCALTLDYARAFLSDVNWHEIADHLNEE